MEKTYWAMAGMLFKKGGDCAFSGMEKINSRTRDYPSLW
jgi:hypothetical protein